MGKDLGKFKCQWPGVLTGVLNVLKNSIPHETLIFGGKGSPKFNKRIKSNAERTLLLKTFHK